MHCPYCGTSNPAQARFCLGCGCLLIGGLVCAACHTLLPPHARYCFHCGAILVLAGIACPQCGVSVAPGQTHCNACGSPVAQPASPPPSPAAAPVAPQPTPPSSATAPVPTPMPAPPVPAVPPKAMVPQVTELVLGELPSPRPLQEVLPSLQRYLPQALYEPLERRPTEHHLTQVRDHLTALLRTAKTYLPRPVAMAPQPAGKPAGGMYQGVFLFGDVSGFTPLSEQLKVLGQAGAERITDIINSLFTELVQVLFAHGGTLLKFGGDALLGLFPAKTNEEMAAGTLRAVQAGLAMQEVMKRERFAAIEAAGETRTLRIKCGISVGPYFAAHIGTRRSMAYVTTGHTVNRAEQAEGHAHPGEVVITQDAYDLTGGQVEVRPSENEPEEGFYLVRRAPPVEGILSHPIISEPPEGDLQAQITYLVARMDRLSPYLNAELIARIVTNPGDARISPDHRPVTVMFANYVGVSDLIEDMGDTQPELITRHLNNYFVHMAEVVERYEGTLARMDQYAVGDRLVIFFGAPRAHEDDPVRAVYTALDMQKAMRDHFAALQTPEGIYRFRQRIGINTGHLFAGNAGAPELRQEYTLMGDDINMAARLMSKAGWQEIFISKKTQERVVAFFDLEDRGELKVKGKEILIPTFAVLGRRGEIGQTRGLESGESPLTGRDDTLQTLKNCGQGLLSGLGHVVSIVGDSGVGKSRIMREVKAWLLSQEGADEVHWLEGHALSFSEQMSYWLAIQVLRGALDLEPDANEDDVLFSLWERGEKLLGKETAREAIPFLADLMGLELEGEWAKWVKELDSKVRQKQTFWAAREFFTAAARQRPTVIALDDLHWADEASLALLEDLLEVTVHAPLMFCLIFRPQRHKGCWRLRDKAASAFPHRYKGVTLQPLAEAHSQELLGKLLPGAGFSPQTLREILNKSAGNPFYLEEVVRSLIDTGAVVPEPVERDYLSEVVLLARDPGAVIEPSKPNRWQVTGKIEQIIVPDSLQGAIMDRIDRLTEDARLTLQMAAVIGRRFQMEVLRSLVQAETELGTWLAQLERSDLIQPAESTTEPAYIFPDALVQEVAYDNLLIQRRQEFHRRVGETLEAILADRASDKTDGFIIDLDGDGIPEQGSELLAYHFRLSDDHERAIKYLEIAGHNAQAEFANETALQHYTDLLALLGDQEKTWEKRFDVLARRQQVYSLLGQQEAREADLEAMLALAQAHDDEARRSDALNSLADLYQWTSRYDEAEAAAHEALTLKNKLGDQAGQAVALHQLGVVEYYRGDYSQAKPSLERAISLWRAIKGPEGEAWSLMYLGMIHFVQGNYSDAAKYHEHALEVAQARQDWFQVGIHLTNAARVSFRLGEYQQALEQFQQSLEMKMRVGDRLGQGFTLFGMGLVHTYLGRYDEAESAFQASLELRQQINDERGIGYCLHGLGLVALGRSQFDQAEDYFQQAYEMRSRLGLKAETIADLSYLGQARLGLGKLDEATEVSEQAIALLAEQKNVEEVQQIYLNHFRVLVAQCDPSAGEFLQRAYDAMMCQANHVSDQEKRQAFLDKVKVNQEIIVEVESDTWDIQTA
jgi:class 3 adenylate cyclase/predicted ATPase